MSNKAFPPAPKPKSALGRYRLLSPTAAVRVSPICLGGMNFGDAWQEMMGTCNQDNVDKILDFFRDQGGNFIDTSNNYQFGESEEWIGEWMEKRGVRDEMVIATKYTTNYRAGPAFGPQIMANFTGNGTKSLITSVNASLKKLRTDYIDLLYVHWWDYSTSIPELMQSLNQLVLSGKVLYLGVSDTPAWVVSKANEYARNHGLRQFCVYQGRWSVACRDVERDIVPMCKAEGMGIAPWGSLGGGAFKDEASRKAKEGRGTEANRAQVHMSKVLEGIARRKKTHITSVALAYIMHKTTYVFPIVGGRTIGHLQANINALSLELSEEDMAEIENAMEFDLGFPHDFIWGDTIPSSYTDVWLLSMGGRFDNILPEKPIPPYKTGE